MNDDDYQKLIEKFKQNYFLIKDKIIKDIIKDYKFKIKGKEYSSVLAFGVSYSLESAASLVIFENDIDIKYIFEQTDFTSIILLKKDGDKIYIRKGLEDFEEINTWPKISYLTWLDTKYSVTFLTRFWLKMLEMLIVARILTPILRIFIPPLGNRLLNYYSDPLHRVVRKRDVDILT